MTILSRWFSNVLLAVGVILTFAAAAVALPSPPPENIRAKAEDTFNRPEFRPSTTPSNSWLSRQIASFSEWLATLSRISPVLSLFVRMSCVLVAATLIGFFIFLIVRAIRRARSVADIERNRKIFEANAKRAWLSANYRAEATRLAKAGDFTEAIRFLFLALVYRFDERGRVSFHQEYTNREYLELLSDRRKVRDAMQLLVDILDDHWYGQRPCDREQYEDCLAVYERLAA
jgi:hypothetical protein